jgi:5-formyltetrahydrofolate cyclo-ligase
MQPADDAVDAEPRDAAVTPPNTAAVTPPNTAAVTAPNTAADKAALRRQFAAARARRSPADLADARAAIAGLVLERCRAQSWSTVAAYVPLRSEPGSLSLLTELDAAGVQVLVPVVLPDRDLDWVRWDDDLPSDPMADADSSRPRLGVEAVARAAAVLVPAFAVSRGGTRLGRGGGSYDRALRRVAPGAAVAALLFDGEVVDRLPADPWDRPVTHAVTPDGWLELRGNAVISQDG